MNINSRLSKLEYIASKKLGRHHVIIQYTNKGETREQALARYEADRYWGNKVNKGDTIRWVGVIDMAAQNRELARKKQLEAGNLQM